MIERPSQYSRYEHILKQCKWTDSADVREKFALISRRVRLSRQDLPAHEQVIWDTGANVIGPLYVAYVWWLLQDAKALGIKRLYFMARDGKILKEIADILISKGGFSIETKYLYVSREAVLYASIDTIDDFDIRWLMWNPVRPLAIKAILKRLDIAFDEVKDELGQYGIKDENYVLFFKEKFKFRSFFREPRVKDIILERAQKRYELAMAYLKQDGFADNVPYALVDLGWVALSQYAISRMLDKGGCRPTTGVKGYYLGTNWLLKRYRNDKLKAFLFDASNIFGRMGIVQYELPEIFATAPDGRTLRYERQAECINPVFDKRNDKGIKWGVEVQQLSVITFAEEIVAVMPLRSWQEVVPTARIRKVFDSFCNFPSLAEANAYGSFKHGADIEEDDSCEISPISKFRDVLKICAGYYWVPGVVARSQWKGRRIIVSFFVLVNIVRHVVLVFIDKFFRWGYK